ncbi:MAG: isopentenyl phosphate kinase [Chloroflexota bacterium]|nr:isopentenyl phosphate kinase [Chloroflexota bacterium]
MHQLTFVKLGGSLITDKRRAGSYHADAVRAVGMALHDVLRRDPDHRILIGHGSGSFGHVVAARHGTIDGVRTPDEWRGFAEVASAAADLNGLVTTTLREVGLPVWRLQPSASALASDGELTTMAIDPIRAALDHALVPLVYGDVALDTVRGGTIISTETVFFYLAAHLPVTEILLLGDVDGVWDEQRQIIPLITPSRFASIQHALGGSAGTDVTGGMLGKVTHMLRLVTAQPGLSIRIMGGEPTQIASVLDGSADYGTLIRANDEHDARLTPARN